MGRLRKWVPYALLLPGLLWLAVFFVLPVARLFEFSVYEGSFEQGYHPIAPLWTNYLDGWRHYSAQVWRSLWYALLATLACLLIGYPLAYAIALKGGRWKALMLIGVIAPFFTSFLVRTYAWKAILGDSGPLVGFLKAVHLMDPDGRLLATEFAVIAGLTYNFIPFMVLPLYASLEKVDTRLLEASADLFHGPVRTFFRVTLPLSMPGVVAGTLLTFIPAAGDYVNAELLGNPNTQMIGKVIQSKFLVTNEYPVGAALSFLLMAIILVMVVSYVRRAGTDEVV
ncbi:MAG TPA: ABC transporter permease [Micromonosporaceae bacterium]|nr:ABC transporter permease [Micromonosporaceae bacterium]